MPTAAPAPPALEDLRREIDEIDRALHDLIMRRTEVARMIGAAKASGNAAPAAYFSPAREAMVLRNLLARHQGPFPKPVLMRIWREMVGTLLRLQTPFNVALCVPDAQPGFFDLARDHFGSHIPITSFRTTGQVIRAVLDGSAIVGVLPYPAEQDAQPWWPMLVAHDTQTPRIVARLPFAGRGNGRADGLDAAVIARLPAEETGRDRSLIAMETAEISRSRLNAALAKAELTPSMLISWRVPGVEGGLHLMELQGCITAGDPRLAALAGGTEHHPVKRVVSLGVYADPLEASELA